MSGACAVRVALTVFALAAGAVGVRGYFIPEPVRTWPDGDIPVHEQLAWSGGTLIDGSANLNVAFESAVDTWNQYLGRVRFVPVRGSTEQIGDGNRVNNVILSPTIFDEPFNENTLATTTTWYNTRTDRLSEFDIIYNDKWNWNAYRGARRSPEKDAVRLGLRQLGVALGLGAPDRNGQTVSAIMNASVGDLDTLTFDDISGALSLYGPGEPVGSEQVTRVTMATDATGVASFRIGERSIPIRFVDPETGSPIPGANAYLFTDPNGLAFTALVDPLGRYFTRIAPVRLPVRSGGGAFALATRATEVAVPPIRRGAPLNAVIDSIAGDPALRSLWWDIERRANSILNDLRAAEVIVERDLRLDQVSEVSLGGYLQDERDEKLDEVFSAVVEGLGDRTVNSVLSFFGHFTEPLGQSLALRDGFWLTARAWQQVQGYREDQMFRVRIVRLPVNVPEGLRTYTEWQFHMRPLEEPKDPWVQKRPGVISGALVQVAQGRTSPTSGTVTLQNDDQFSTAAPSSGLFTIPQIAPGWQTVFARKERHRTARQMIFVEGDGKLQRVRLELVPQGVLRIAIRATAARIRQNQVASFHATVYGMDDRPMNPQPRVFWNSDTPSVATIDRDTGGVRGVRAGRTGITAQAPDFGVASDPFGFVVERSTPCSYSLSNTRFTAPVEGGAANVTVTTETDCDWTADPTPTSMLGIISGGRGPGTGTFRFSVSRNAGSASRTGAITISGMSPPNTVTITQRGTSSGCTVTLSPTSLSFRAGATSGPITVAAASDCAWTAAVTSGSFLSIASGRSGTGNGTVIVAATANTGSSRTGTVSIQGKAVTVSQAGSGASGTTMTGEIRCTRGITGGGIYNNLTCTGTVSLTLGAGFVGGNSYLGLFATNDVSLRTSSFAAAAAGSTYTLTVSGRGAKLDPDRPPCPPRQTQVGFYHSGQVSGAALVTTSVSIPVSCN